MSLRGSGAGTARTGWPPDMPWGRQDVLAVAFIAAATIVATFQLWKPGVPSPVDLICAVYRAFELEQSIAGGILFPRMGMSLNFGYGAPLFEFYAPLASYATLFVHWAGLGYVEAAKGVFVAALFVGALGAYVYARWLFGSRLPALVSGAAFLFAPYLLTNAYQRGALAESLALSLLPWLFWTFHRLLTSDDRHWVFPAAAVLALLILSHNITAMFVVVFLAGSIGWQALRTRSWRRLPWLVAAALLGLVASAFFWLPAIAESGYTVVDSVLGGRATIGDSLAEWSAWVQPWLAFDYYGDLRFSVALVEVVIGCAAAAVLRLQSVRVRALVAPLAVAAAIMLLLETRSSQWLWETVPVVRYIQFAWRLSGLVSFAVAMLAGSLVQLELLPAATRKAVAAGLITLLALASLWNLSPSRSPFWHDFTSDQVGSADLRYRGTLGFPVYADFVPRWVTVESKDLGQPNLIAPAPAAPAAVGGSPSVVLLEETLTSVRMRVRADQPWSLSLHKFYFPGWEASVDGTPLPVAPGGPLGLVTMQVPAGEHLLYAGFGETALRTVANLVSLLGIAIVLAGLAWSRYGRRVLAAAGICLLVGVGLLWRGGGLGEAVARPSLSPRPLGNGSIWSVIAWAPPRRRPARRCDSDCTGACVRRRGRTTRYSCTW